MAIKCPACETPLDPSAVSCPVCLRKRTRAELMQGLKSARVAQESRRRRPLLVLAAVLAAAAAGWGAYRYRPFLLALLQPPAAPSQTAAPAPAANARPNGASDGSLPLAAPPPAAAPILPPEPAAAPVEAVYTTLPPPNLKKPAKLYGDPEVWSVRGDVYDLLSLKPVSGARVVFTSRTDGKSRSVKTDAKGRYRLKLPKLKEGGYNASVSHAAYRPIFLEEMDPPYRTQKAARREDAAQTAVTSQVLHVPFLPEYEQDEVEYGVVLLPLQ